MSVTPSITEDRLVEELAQFVTGLVGPDVPVVRGYVNRVPPPRGSHIYITPLQSGALSLPWTQYQDDYPLTGVRKLTRPTRWTAQIDCYGDQAQGYADAISIALRSGYGCEQMDPAVCQPLYTSEPRQLPFVTGEAQYQERWTLDAVLQFNPEIVLAQQFAASLHIDLVEVDTTYPPGA